MKINILDYNCGNIWSVKNAFSFLGFETNIIKTANQVLDSDCLILPGDGSFKIIRDIKNNNLIDSLNHMAKIKKIPILGICLGMQLLAHLGSEGNKNNFSEGLKLIEGNVESLRKLGTTRNLLIFSSLSSFFFAKIRPLTRSSCPITNFLVRTSVSVLRKLAICPLWEQKRLPSITRQRQFDSETSRLSTYTHRSAADALRLTFHYTTPHLATQPLAHGRNGQNSALW